MPQAVAGLNSLRNMIEKNKKIIFIAEIVMLAVVIIVIAALARSKSKLRNENVEEVASEMAQKVVEAINDHDSDAIEKLCFDYKQYRYVFGNSYLKKVYGLDEEYQNIEFVKVETVNCKYEYDDNLSSTYEKIVDSYSSFQPFDELQGVMHVEVSVKVDTGDDTEREELDIQLIQINGEWYLFGNKYVEGSEYYDY